MQLIDKLTEEHRLIELGAGSLIAFHREFEQGKAALADLAGYAVFFRDYADAYHHGKEEQILMVQFPALGIDSESPPLRMLREEHRGNKILIEKFFQFAAQTTPLSDMDKEILRQSIFTYVIGLWEHIDKEDSVLFAEANLRFKGMLAQTLDKNFLEFEARMGQPGNLDIPALESNMRGLFLRFPPVEELPGVLRGEGCVSCRHYGGPCQGVEKEWWSEHEWEDFFERNR